MTRKENRQFRFTVEGETEKWYLERLQSLINNDENAAYRVVFKIDIDKKPYKKRLNLSVLDKTVIYHFMDVETPNAANKKAFLSTLEKLKKPQSGKDITFELCYSNVSFELWILLHKTNFNAPVSSPENYLSSINRYYGTSFSRMSKYKEELNFKGILENITLEDVKCAIDRAKKIMKDNKECGLIPIKSAGYEYYAENPSLSVHKSIAKILKTCNI